MSEETSKGVGGWKRAWPAVDVAYLMLRKHQVGLSRKPLRMPALGVETLICRVVSYDVTLEHVSGVKFVQSAGKREDESIVSS